MLDTFIIEPLRVRGDNTYRSRHCDHLEDAAWFSRLLFSHLISDSADSIILI